MQKIFEFNYHYNYMPAANVINNINRNDNNENISPIENINFNSYPPIIPNNSEPVKKKKFPNYPIKNIFLPELFLEQEYLEKYTCGICENVCDDPVYQCCGCKQIFCKKCLLFYYDNNNKECPECKQINNKDPISFDAIDIVIKKFKMKCINHTVNCTWQGPCKDYKEHITKKCPKEIINCPFKGCIIKLKREEMEEHMKKCEYYEIICEKCKLKINKNDQFEHKKVCLKEKISCPQGCGEMIERGDYNLHKPKCIYSYIDCPYSIVGCSDKFQIKDKNIWLNKDMDKHLNLMKIRISNLENIIKGLKEENQMLKNENLELKKEKEKKNNKETENNNNSEKNIFEFQEAPPIDNIISLLESENNDNIEKNEKNEKKDKNEKKEKIVETTKDNEIKTEIEIENEKTNIENTKNFLSNKRKFESSNENNNQSITQNPEIDNSSETKMEIDNKEENKSQINTNKCDIYELLDTIKDLFIIKNNLIETKILQGKKQYYVFFKKEYDIPKQSTKKYIIQFKLLKTSLWLGLGVCDKKIVARNNYDFNPPKKKDGKRANIGTYVISINKMTWNCNNMSQCKKLDCTFYKGMIIECILSPAECELEFKYENNLIIKFNDVRCFKSDFFSPCLVFLYNNAVETTFIYPE